MKYSLFLILIFFSINGFAKDKKVKHILSPYSPKEVYLPKGFDDNDNSEIIFYGEFQDTCYKTGQTKHRVDKRNKAIFITDLNTHTQGVPCTQMIVHYTKVVRLGNLEEGSYRVFFKNPKKKFEQHGVFHIEKAQSSQVDNYLYAPIEQITYRRSTEGQPSSLTLQGRFYNSCMDIDRIEVMEQKEENTVAILPIAYMRDELDCFELPFAKEFSKTVTLENISRGRKLMHIRVLNGQAINRVVELED